MKKRPLQERIRDIPAKWLSLTAFGLLFLRSWPRLLSPQVWDEDGTLNLYGYLTRGFSDLAQPINGYLAVISKLISIFSASFSFTLYPLTGTLAAWALTIFAFVVLAKAPLRLKGGFLLGTLCMLVPTDPEVFGLPLYSTWWAALLMFAAAFWDEKAGHFYFRLLVIVIASLSSPFCLVTLPVFWARAVMFRGNPREGRLALAASLLAAIQLWAMWPITSHARLPLGALPRIIPMFLGNYAVGNLYPGLTEVLGLLIFAYVLGALVRGKPSWTLWALCYLWAASVLISISRITIYHLHPVYTGPRYFFFPFVVLGWLLLQIILERGRPHFRAVGAALLVMSVINALPCLTRKHDDLDWRGHVSSCAQFHSYSLPVHFDGSAANAWYFTLEGCRCADLLARDPFRFLVPDKTYPHTVIDMDSEAAFERMNAPGATRVKAPAQPGGDPGRQADYELIGSFIVVNSGPGSVTLRLRRGDRVLLRNGPEGGLCRVTIEGHEERFLETLPPARYWTILEFSSRLLPATFRCQFQRYLL